MSDVARVIIGSKNLFVVYINCSEKIASKSGIYLQRLWWPKALSGFLTSTTG